MANVMPGDVLAGKYRVDRVIGEGGMGVVVAATHIQLEERYALKFMLPRAMENPDASSRFLQEARAAAKLKSEHVARVHDVGVLESGAPYIVMEYLEGDDLSRILERRGPLSFEEVADYVLQTCDAVAEAHARGIVHRDLKPANLFVTRGSDGYPLVKVLDFGISKASALSDSQVSRTKSSVMLGSPLYMSPEQMKSARDVEASTDQWSLGVILYEAVGGRVPYDAGTVGALMAKVLTEPPPSLQSVRRDVPDAFAAIVNRCLERDPARRYPNVAMLAHDIKAFAPERVRPLADRVASVLRTSQPGGPVPAAAVSGLDATMADPTGSHSGQTGNRALGGPLDPSRPQTAGGWGTTASDGSSRRTVVAVVAGIAVAVLTVGIGVAALLRLRAMPAPVVATASAAPVVSVVAVAPAALPASVSAAPSAVGDVALATPPAAAVALSATLASSLSPTASSAPRATPHLPPTPRPHPSAPDAFGDSRK